ncbi:MAG: hypothetical protein ACYDA8_09090 [Deferrisomatales bacterium]
MSKIQWEYDLVERPFCEQLQSLGWTWIEGDTDVAELTERESFREVLLTGAWRPPCGGSTSGTASLGSTTRAWPGRSATWNRLPGTG